jgi:hypothetical protein
VTLALSLGIYPKADLSLGIYPKLDNHADYKLAYLPHVGAGFQQFKESNDEQDNHKSYDSSVAESNWHNLC